MPLSKDLSYCYHMVKTLVRSLFFGALVVVLCFTASSMVQAAISEYGGKLLYTSDNPTHLWYVSPVNSKRYYLGSSVEEAIRTLRPLALGVNRINLNKIPMGDSSLRGDMALRRRVAGRFLLSVQDGGMLWYVTPNSLKRYYLAPTAASYTFIRGLAQPVTDRVLTSIEIDPSSRSVRSSESIQQGNLPSFTVRSARVMVETSYSRPCEQVVTARARVSGTASGRVIGYFVYEDGFRTPELSLELSGVANEGDIMYRRQIVLDANRTTSNSVHFIATRPSGAVSVPAPFETVCNRSAAQAPLPTERATESIQEQQITLAVTVDGGATVAACTSHAFTFRGTITASRAGTVWYVWRKSDGSMTEPAITTFPIGGGSSEVVYREQVPTATNGSVTLLTLSPDESAQSVSFRLTNTDCSVALPVPSQPVVPQPAPTPLAPTAPPDSEVNATNWRARALALVIDGYRREERPDGMLVLSSDVGKYQVVLPNIGPNAEAFGKFTLKKLKTDVQSTQALLGRPPFLLSDRIVVRYKIDSSSQYTGLCCGEQSENFPLYWYFRTEADYLREIDLGLPEHAWILARWGQLQGDHELVHRFLVGTNIYPVFNEGLAQYIPQRLNGRTGSSSYECRDTGYIAGRNGMLIPYYREGEPYNSTTVYPTGECFWWLLHERFGPDVVAQVMTRLQFLSREDRTQDGPSAPGSGINYNIRRLFLPVLGDPIWTMAAPFGASPTGI